MGRKFKEKFLKKIFAIIMAFLLVVNSGGLVLVYAEDPSPPVGGSGQVDPTPTPEQTITTGGASSDASSDTTANVNIDQVPGEISTPSGDCTPPEGQISCPITNDNTADTSSGIDSSAQTGQNQSTGSLGDASINTGDATASGSIENNINNNVVEGQAPDPTPTEGLNVSNTNDAVVQNEGDVSAGTGQNLATENAGNVDIITGDALALANLFNLLNTNIVGSNFELLILNLVDQNGNIDLNALWREILLRQTQDQLVLASQTNLQNLTLLIQNNNQADLENNLQVTAVSGQNQANENNGDVSVNTGDATALANVANIVNINLFGSKFLLVFINILSSFNGDLILPRPENFTTDIPGLESQTSALVQNQGGTQTAQNQAEISGSISANADSGTNTVNNNPASTIVTGDANSASTTLTFANLNIQRNNWFFLVVNNLGSWLGSLLGWSNPQSSESPTDGTNTYSLGLEAGTNSDQTAGLGDGNPSIVVENQNQANIRNEISAQAVSGQNQVNDNGGQAEVRTGKARALANLLNLINLNIFGGRWFMGLVNVLGDWNGNTVFAYPDVAISISGPAHEVVPGEEAFYNINFQNQGYDEAQNVQVKLELPKGESYVSDSSGFTPQISGQNYLWSLGNIAGETAGSFQVKVKIDSNLSLSDLLSFWQKIIPQAQAAEDGQKGNLLVKADVSTIDPQSNTSNDSSQTTTTVYFPPGVSAQENFGTPVLEITAKNNVGEFVYSGDTVTFELILKNTGNALAKNVSVSQMMYDGAPEDLGSVDFPIGDLDAGKSVKLNFGLVLQNDLEATIYTSVAKAHGQTLKGDDVFSNEGRTQFEVRDKNPQAVLPEAIALENQRPGDGEVLGGQDSSTAQSTSNWLPYFLVTLLGTLGLTSFLKKRKVFAQRR